MKRQPQNPKTPLNISLTSQDKSKPIGNALGKQAKFWIAPQSFKSGVKITNNITALSPSRSVIARSAAQSIYEGGLPALQQAESLIYPGSMATPCQSKHNGALLSSVSHLIALASLLIRNIYLIS